MLPALLTDILQARPGTKAFIGLFISILSVIVLGYVFLFAVALLPQESLRKNILQADSRGFFSENYPQYAWLRPLFNRLDMYTECIGVGIALNMKPDAKTLLEMPTFGECTSLHKVISVKHFDATPHHYMRFIHGHQVVLKSMYTFFSLETVRAITAGTSLLLLIFLYIALKHRIDTRYAALVVSSFFLTASPNMFFTVTHATPFWLVLTAAIAATLGRRICPLIFFGVAGALDAFLNFLIMGSLSLALPLLCYSLAQWAEGESPGRIAAAAFWGGIGWSFGYVLPWLLKWLVLFLALAPTKAALFGVTLELYPTRGLTMIITAVQRNFLSANWPYIALAFVVCALRRRRMALKTPPGLWMACLPGLIPLFWMCILPGQSGIAHSTFVNLILWPFLAACLLLLLSMPRENQDGAP